MIIRYQHQFRLFSHPPLKPLTHVCRNSSRHCGSETLPQSGHAVLSDKLSGTVHEAGICPLGRTLETGFDSLRSKKKWMNKYQIDGRRGDGKKEKKLTSGGIPKDHMAIPAPPPAAMMAGTLKGGAGALEPSGKVSGAADNIFLRYS